MLIDYRNNPDLPFADICVVGAGPIGIAVALACEAQGFSVLLIESGRDAVDVAANRRSHANILDPRRHASMDVAVCRGLGGTSRWWGGRCVPYDDLDFAVRPNAPDAEWPIKQDDIKPWYKAAAAYLGCGNEFVVDPPLAWHHLDEIAFDSIERWLPQIDMGRQYKSRLKESRRITVLLGATVTDLEFSPDNSSLQAIRIADPTKSTRLSAQGYVLACGGLETTRLLLANLPEKSMSPRAARTSLGRYYMGHISGKIADIVLTDPTTIADHDFFLEGGNFVRRRMTIRPDILIAERVFNIAFWIDNPRFSDPAHKNSMLSLVWLVLAIPPLGRKLLPEAIRLIHVGERPYRILAHVRNLFRSPIGAISNSVRIFYAKFVRSPKKPGFLLRNPAGRYALHYHAEQLPSADSRMTLSNEHDDLGCSRLSIDLQFGEYDARSVLRAHAILDRGLRKAGLGRLEYYVEEEKRLSSVLDQASDGFHQLGTTRMGNSPDTSVVNRDCRVHGIDNLFVASTSVFPSSGQANPTFLGVALALRLASLLAKIFGGQEKRSSDTT